MGSHLRLASAASQSALRDTLVPEEQMPQEVNISNPSNVNVTQVSGFVTTLGAQDAASGNQNDTWWFVIVGGVIMTTRNRDFIEIFSLSIQENWQVSVGYTDGKEVFYVRIDRTA